MDSQQFDLSGTYEWLGGMPVTNRMPVRIAARHSGAQITLACFPLVAGGVTANFQGAAVQQGRFSGMMGTRDAATGEGLGIDILAKIGVVPADWWQDRVNEHHMRQSNPVVGYAWRMPAPYDNPPIILQVDYPKGISDWQASTLKGRHWPYIRTAAPEKEKQRATSHQILVGSYVWSQPGVPDRVQITWDGNKSRYEARLTPPLSHLAVAAGYTTGEVFFVVFPGSGPVLKGRGKYRTSDGQVTWNDSKLDLRYWGGPHPDFPYYWKRIG